MTTDDVDSLIGRVANKIDRIDDREPPVALAVTFAGLHVLRGQVASADLHPTASAMQRALAYAHLLAASLEACRREAPTLLNRMRADEALNLAIRLAADPEDRA